MYSFPPDSTGFVQRMPVGSILLHLKEFRNIHLHLFQFFPCWNLVRICIWTWDSITKNWPNVCCVESVQKNWCHRWGLWVVGHMRSSKEFPCHQSVARDRAITSAGSQCIANQAKRPGIQHRVCKQFATLEIPLRSVTKVVTSNKLKLK